MIPVEFFDHTHPQHSCWSLGTFHNWLSVIHPHIHTGMGTVYGGPHGARQIGFVISRVSSALEMVGEKANLPVDLRRIIAGSCWDAENARQQLSRCMMEMRRQVACSSSTLQLLFHEWAHAWQMEIECQYWTQKDAGTLRPRALNEPRLTMSSGVPTTAEALEAIWESMRPKQSKGFQQDESLEALRVLSIVPLSMRGMRQDPNLDTAELICSPRGSELSASSGEHQIIVITWN